MRTNGDLARYASALRYALDTCAAKIDALNVFFVDTPPEQPGVFFGRSHD